MPFTIEQASRATASHQPLLVAVLTLTNGTIYRWSTHPLNTSEGGTAPVISGWTQSGQSFAGRITRHNLGALAQSEQGIDQLSSVDLGVADPDAAIWAAVEVASGFKGASLVMWLLYWSVGTTEFSTDVKEIWSGIVQGAASDKEITITARSRVDLAKVRIPPVLIAHTCQWSNPVTVAQRATANDPDSDFFECGETRDLATAPPCSYTRATCTQPLRFSGLFYEGPKSFDSVSYIDKRRVQGDNAGAQLGEPIPMVYGTVWVTPRVTSVSGEGNSNRAEAVLTVGEVAGSGDTDPGDVQMVIVNGHEVPFVRYSSDKPVYRWQWITTGTRDGAPNLDAPWNGQGNPYGSQAAILIVVYPQIAQPGSLPSVRILMRGPKIRVYSDATNYTLERSTNPVWVLLDLLTWGSRKYADFDLASFVAIAARCSATINYPLPGGGTGSHERFDCSLAISDKRTLKEVIDGLLRSFHGALAEVGGKITLRQRSTLAIQQPAPVAGSNFVAAIASVNFAGSATNGYSAFDFDEESIQVDRATSEPKFKVFTEPGDQANRLSLWFSDRDNRYLPTPYSVTDSNDVNRVGERNGSLEVLGLNSADQAARIGRAFIAERLYGNSRNDSGGTQVFEFVSDTRANHLRVGDIVRVKCAPWITSFVQARVETIRYTTNMEEATIRARYHKDAWYVDSFGQAQGEKAASSDATNDAPPQPWQPDEETPITGNALHAASDKGFSLVVDYSGTDADGNVIPVAIVTGKAPVTRTGLLSPVVARAMSIATSGGSLVGSQKQYWAAIVATDSAGNLSSPSLFASAVITTSGTTHRLTLSIINWPGGATGYRVYASDDPAYLTLAATGSGTPSTINIDAIAVSASALPDPKADRLQIIPRTVAHSGVWAAAANDVLANKIEITGASWTTDEWVGRVVTLLHKDSGAAIPIADFTVTANDSNQLTVSPNPVGVVEVGDVVTMRAACSIAAQTITDTKWINALSGGSGLTVNEERGRSLFIFAGTGAGYEYLIESNTTTAITIVGDWKITPDATSRYVVFDSEVGSAVEQDVSDNAEVGKQVAVRLELKNYAGRVLMLTGHILTSDGKRSIATLAPRREVYIAGVAGSGGGVGTAPTVTFNATLREYGKVSVENCAISGASTLGRLQGVTVTVFYVAEVTADVWVSLNSAVGGGHPLIVGCIANPSQVTPSGTLAFTAGQLCLFAEAGHYELAKITDITSGVFTFERLSILGSSISAHPSGTKVYIVQERVFTFAPSSVDYGASSSTITIADRMDCEIPNACVVAVQLSTTFNGATGPRTTVNTALATVPGLRTLTGHSYRWQLAGTLAVNQLGIVQRVQYESNIRVAFTRAGTAPTGSALTIILEKSSNNGGAWTTAATVTIAAGATESFVFASDPPAPRRTPYSGSWPWEEAILRPDDLLRPKVTAVGSSVAGANVTIEVYA